MKLIGLNDGWVLRWCDGQRGAMPHYIHRSPAEKTKDIQGVPKEIPDEFDAAKWIEATVPGDVHLDLMKAGIMASPYEGANVLHCRWVEECLWFYRRVFDAPEAAGARLARLVFEGLDYAAVIYLNGREIARHENAFYPCEIDVSGQLLREGNVLLVRLESGLFSVCDKPIREYYTATMTMDALLHKRNWMRKTQSQMAWDWSPRLMNIGIYKPVTLLYGEELLVDNASVACTLDEALKTGEVGVRLFAAQHDGAARSYSLTVEAAGRSVSADFDGVPADGMFAAALAVENPELWWPAGYGDAVLYDVRYTLEAEGRTLYEGVKTVGFRHVAVDQAPHPQGGRYFIFRVNGVPVFMKGSNMVPNDLFTVSMTPDRYEALTDLAREANFNFLRIWGGGLYESEAFYDCCNRKGIMVWQEFIAACATIPHDEALWADIRREAVWQVRRLSSHPSLVAWCGNNEIGWAEEGPAFHVGDDDPLYEKIFPSILEVEDPGKYYQPTSPWSPDGLSLNDETAGDQHPWSVGFMNKDSRDYEDMVCRFPNEGGILGPSSLKTMRACLSPGEDIHSFSWQVHDNMLEGWMPGSSPDEDVRFWLGRETRDMSLEEYVYAGGLVQAEGLKRYIDNFRRRMYDSSSAVFWMYNDCWPTTRSWTVVDYYLRRTPSFHPVRRAFEPVAPVIARTDGEYTVYGVNDTLEDFAGVLHYGVFTTGGRYVVERRVKVSLPANGSRELSVLAGAEMETAGLERSLAFACLYGEDGCLAGRTRYSPLRLCEMELPATDICVERHSGGYSLTADGFVMGVCLGLDGDEAVGDNLFDLYPGQPYFVRAEEARMPFAEGFDPIRFDLNSFFGAPRRVRNVLREETKAGSSLAV